MTAARLGIVRDEPHENIIDLLEAAVQAELPRDDEVDARRFLASQYRFLAVEQEESYLDGHLWSKAVKHLEYAVKVDSDQGYGVFHDPRAIGILPAFDALYTLVADSIAERNGADAAIAYLESKLRLFDGVPGDPMGGVLIQLGALYHNEADDKQRARACYRRVLRSQPIVGCEEQQEKLERMARDNLALMDGNARSKAGRWKADTAMALVLLSLCCSPLVLPGIIFGLLAINDLIHGGSKAGIVKATMAVVIGTFLVLLVLVFFLMAASAPIPR
jgi:tetratricopeptide (TPR) repeat protein